MKRWFAEGAEDPALRILVVEPDAAEYWESPSGLISILKMAKATLIGAPVDLGENEAFLLKP
jgi:hypothetical protein